MLVYKIKHPSGKFSTGGSNPTFTRDGKIWIKSHHLKSHLKVREDYKNLESLETFYNKEKCVIVSYNLIQEEKIKLENL